MGTKQYTMDEVRNHNTKDDCWLVISRKVYDVTNWIPRHPGGRQIIINLAGRDVTDLFLQNHPDYVTKYLPTYFIGDLVNYKESAALLEFRKFAMEVEKDGYFKTSYLYYTLKFLCVLAILSVSVVCYVIGYQKNWGWLQIVGSVVLAAFLQQVAFLGHDAGHNCITHDRFKDTMFGLVVGPLLSGISMAWWKDSHNVHHAVTNVLQCDPDIQHLPFLAVDSTLFKSLYSFYHHKVMSFDGFARLMVSYQHILFYPLMAFARFFLYIQSMILILFKDCEYRKSEFFTTVGFWTWFLTLHSYCVSYPVLIACLVLSHACAGILHVQIVLSHFAMDMYETDWEDDFLDMQLKTSLDVDCPWYMDWFHGGLQFQTVHHLFPRVPRHKLGALQLKTREWCAKNNKPYYLATFFEANKQVVQRLKAVAQKAKFNGEVDTSMIWDALAAQG